ncbi:MAG: bi-domain-containing oxidoreductase [Bacteroidota bacterium]
MQQLVQQLRNGEMQLLEVPFPALPSGCVLVRNHFSVISTGTEGKTVKDARAGLITKARSRKEDVAKVLKAARTYGLLDTYRMVMNRLDAPSPLGYCCAGEVIAIASDVTGLKVGDRVACGGNTAVHAEVVAVPMNLCVRIDTTVPLDSAAFTTLGAIALQGVRQADLRLGENCAVIGLGLVGQLTIQLLKASGVKAFGIDVDPRPVRLASTCGADLALERNREDLENVLLEATGGHGVDAVIITAAADSTDPIDLAGVIARKKGRVIVVGAVPTGFKRTHYFRKELDLRMSGSYGPGRYDSEYEEGGIDYPYAYVRWTENRNMQAFAELLREGKLKVDQLVSHRFAFNEAVKAYDMIVERTEPFTGVVLEYDTQAELLPSVQLKEQSFDASLPNIGLVGAGSFAQSFLLPAIKGHAGMVMLATSRPNAARDIGQKFGFAAVTGNSEEVFRDSRVNTVFVATRHDSHASYVLRALEAGKHVFVEKPLCLDPTELDAIRQRLASGSSRLMVGFNRRFAPFTRTLKEKMAVGSAIAIHYRINAGTVPPDHWVHDPKIGGGRILGEACHFIDYCMYLAGAPITHVSAVTLDVQGGKQDTVAIQLRFANGSIASIDYFSNGNPHVPKERIEVFSRGSVAVIEDFKVLSLFGKSTQRESMNQDKGHAAGIRAFLDSIRNGTVTPIPFDEIDLVTRATFAVVESAAMNGTSIRL